TVYRADDNGFDPTIQVRESGSPDSLTVLIDRIARKIVAGVSPGAQADLTELAGLTTRSNDALKAYLRGRLQFREGRHRSAVADFEKAVAADSNFAIGWYALGRTASFTPERDLERRSLLRAHDLRAQLPTLDQLRIESQLLYASGRIQESERAFREILRRHPDDVDAQFGLAVLLTHAAHRMGRSPSEAEPLLTRVSYYEPKNLDVLNFGRLLAADSRNLKRYDSLSRRYLEISPNADFALPYQAEQAYLRKDTAAENQVLTQLTAADDFLLGFAVTSVGGYLQDLAGAIPIAERFIDTRRSVENQASGRLMLAQLELAQGHWRKASLQLDEAARLDPNSALESRALLSLHPLLRTPVDSLKALYQEVESWKPHATITGSRIDIGRGQQVFEPEFRLYLLGALAARLGNYPAALSAAGELDRREPGEIGREYARGAAASVRAQVALSQGQLDRAVELFERAPVHVWWNMYYWDPFFSQGFERYLRAESLAKLGRYDEAARWYRSNTGAMSLAETMYLVPSLIGLRNVDAKLGRNGEISAIDARLRELWRDPDAEVVASVVDHR
ncbi:MAG: tetratricopeptide repeat protein, partial [Burkholderiales bacterium]